MKVPDISKLTRNPLGIIGLFVWLIYSIAGLVFATSASDLHYSIQLILTLFVVLFPPAILGVFYLLVTKHHNKLYAPSDFKDERLFFRPATKDELKEKETTDELELNEVAQGKEPAQQTQNGGTGALGLISSYSATEAAALDAVEKKSGHKIHRDFVAEVDGRKFIFDGVYQDSKHLELFEVKMYRRPAFKREFLEAVMYRATSILLHESVNNRDRMFRLWLIIVTDFEGEALDEFQCKVKESVDTNNFVVEWVFIPRSKLQTVTAQQIVAADI